ncbi:CD209 antigen-like protein C isoform X2 [Eleutherodactylus coqui]|uniref:CD209 antigen-like protein C isoform X2 n=1 Tax=Eleutherodactylus coqui TaxID=57060 RepID=UPI00346365FD
MLDPRRFKLDGIDEDVYVNMGEPKIETELIKSMEKNKTPTTKLSTSEITKFRRILAALILLIIMFLVLIAFTSLLLRYYLAIGEEMSQLKNHVDDQQRIVLKDVKTVKLNLENVKHYFLQNITAINKTIETICRICPAGWNPIGIFCYYYSMDFLSWNDARDDCIRKGSGLVMLKNKEETDALQSILEKDRYWIGLRRDKENVEWKWLDGSNLSFSNWNNGEPNSLDEENCVESTYTGYWNDLTCTSSLKYVCKKGCCC